MSEATTIARRVLDALVTAGLVTDEQVAGVSEAFPDDGAAGRELLGRGLLTVEPARPGARGRDGHSTRRHRELRA